jgi:succinate dehydrogenase / fumarate reductase iron-sulfur subunit
MRTLTVRIRRYDPEQDKNPRWEVYHIVADLMDRVLDVLLRIKCEHNDTLALRYSCAHGVCGSDAMRINGFNRLACKTLVRSLQDDTLTIEPLVALPVIKDLVVDMKPFFDHYESVMPYLVNDEPPPTTVRLQSPDERARYDDTTKCILCAACTTACPPFWHGQRYVGPAAIVNAHLFVFDSRDRATAERLEILNEIDGAWRCRKVFNCKGACPRGIKVTRAIIEVQLAFVMGSTEPEAFPEMSRDGGQFPTVLRRGQIPRQRIKRPFPRSLAR